MAMEHIFFCVLHVHNRASVCLREKYNASKYANWKELLYELAMRIIFDAHVRVKVTQHYLRIKLSQKELGWKNCKKMHLGREHSCTDWQGRSLSKSLSRSGLRHSHFEENYVEYFFLTVQCWVDFLICILFVQEVLFIKDELFAKRRKTTP